MKSKTKKITKKSFLLQFFVLLIPLIDFVVTVFLDLADYAWSGWDNSIPTVTRMIESTSLYHRNPSLVLMLIGVPYIFVLLLTAKAINKTLFRFTTLLTIGVIILSSFSNDAESYVLNQRIHRVHDAHFNKALEHIQGHVVTSDVSFTPVGQGETTQLAFTLHFESSQLLPEFTRYNIQVWSKESSKETYSHTVELTPEGIRSLFVTRNHTNSDTVTFENASIRYLLEIPVSNQDTMEVQIHTYSSDYFLPDKPILTIPLVET